MIRVRIAPSPTGFAHVGTAYTALFNYAYAKKNKGKMVLRLEDTDVKREVKGAEKAIYDGLSWLGIGWDEGPFKQSERLTIYKKYVDELVKTKKAYEDDGAIRLKNAEQSVSWDDLVRGEITFPGEEVGDFVILKSDGYPTYNFAVVVDDIEMKITHIIRGEEHISNTPRQIALYKALGVDIPEFAHLPTLRNSEHKKLSKRRDPVDLNGFKKDYLPEALINFLCLLGWSHPEEKEVFGMDEFVKHFSLERVRKSGPIFDTKKLDWLNGVYLREKPIKEFAALATKHAGFPVSEQIASLIQERVTKLSDVGALTSFFEKAPKVDRTAFSDQSAGEHISEAITALNGVEWNLDGINKSLDQAIEKAGFKTGDFYMSLRLSMTGGKITPPINESMIILGKDEVIDRLKAAQKVLS